MFMQTEQFITDVAQRGHTEDRELAANISHATVEVLCMYLPAQQTFDLASQLPRELAKSAEAGAQQAEADARDISLEAFFEQVAVRCHRPASEIEAGARAAAATFQNALSRGESIDVALDAPASLEALLTG